MKILVLGASGMAGHVVALYLQEQGYNVIAYTRQPFQYCENIIGDVTDTEKFKHILSGNNLDAVINCIGLLNQFAENNPANAVFINSYIPHFIADTLKNRKTRLIQMSTDCVFAGNTGPYSESSFPDGRSYYDRTKALGEINDEKNLTFRNSIVGPDINEKGIGLFHWFMKQEGSIKGYTNAIWTGVTTLTLAKAMERALTVNLTGLYNLVNNISISKYDLLCLFNKHFRKGELFIEPDDKLKLDKSLRNNRQDFDFIIPSYEEMIKEMREWVDAHKELYPIY